VLGGVAHGAGFGLEGHGVARATQRTDVILAVAHRQHMFGRDVEFFAEVAIRSLSLRVAARSIAGAASEAAEPAARNWRREAG